MDCSSRGWLWLNFTKTGLLAADVMTFVAKLNSGCLSDMSDGSPLSVMMGYVWCLW
jgi:hypothetical protein